MKTKKKFRELKKEQLEEFFDFFDRDLEGKGRKITYLILGGAALVLLDIIPRSTVDLDIVRGDFELLKEAGEAFGIEVQKVTQCTTVDFDECVKIPVYEGKCLAVLSISLEDLLKSKIERNFKQDPDDIAKIISHLHLTYNAFKKIFAEMIPDFVGNPDRLIMHARTVVDINYPNEIGDFYKSFPLNRDSPQGTSQR